MNDDKRRAAQSILAVPFFSELFEEIEKAALNQCINAEQNDDETRRNAAAEVRAIRRVRSRLDSIAEQPTGKRSAPA